MFNLANVNIIRSELEQRVCFEGKRDENFHLNFLLFIIVIISSYLRR